MDRNLHDELIALATEWDRAMVENDVDAIGRYMADDWTIIGSDGGVGDKASFLALVQSGALIHDVMESHDMRVRVYGDVAVVISRGISGGTYQGQPFRGAVVCHALAALRSVCPEPLRPTLPHCRQPDRDGCVRLCCLWVVPPAFMIGHL
jgi:ketosteroid isomerase-like protein